MNSRSKTLLDKETIESLTQPVLGNTIQSISPLGDGEFNAVYSLALADSSFCALKIAPKSTVPVLTYEMGMMEAEVFWYDQIQQHTSIRVPKIYSSNINEDELPAPWFLMEQLPGIPMDKFDFHSKEKEEKQITLISILTEIHDIHHTQYGYVQNGLKDTWHEAIRFMVENELKDAARVSRSSKRGEKLLSYIDEYHSILSQAPCTMVNFDLWPSNILCERHENQVLYSWIDPERSFWGDPIADLVCFEFLVPLEKKTKTLETYNTHAKSPILANKEEQIRYAIMEAYLALIMEVEKYYRYWTTNPGWARNVIVSKLLYRSAFSVLKKYSTK